MEKRKQTYSLITVITMIVGIVIGSGIYFKVDDILLYTGGNNLLGLLVLVIGSGNIIFGSLSFAELSKKTTTSGGITGYFEHFISPSIAAGIGFFQTFIYLPSIVAVIAWVGAIYTGILFSWEMSLELQILLGLVYILFFSTLNILSRVLGGYFQNLTTAIKLLPLILISIAGLFFNQSIDLSVYVSNTHIGVSGIGWLTALVPLAFSYDGWTVALNIAPEVVHPKKNMTKALIIGPLFILFTYLFFFWGMNRILGALFVMTVGDSAINHAITRILGPTFAGVVMIIVLISVLGVLNGMLLGGMRMPSALAEKKIMKAKFLESIHPKYQISISSGILFTGISIFWMMIHYVTQKYNLLSGRDVSEISIVFNYLCYTLLYGQVIYLYFRKIFQNIFTAFISPILAIIGAILILIGSLLSAPTYVLSFLLFCFTICCLGCWYYKLTHISEI